MKKEERRRLRLAKKGKERKSRKSLTLFFSVFVFIILLAAVMLTALTVWILGKAGVFIKIDGKLEISTIMLFVFLISIILGTAATFLLVRIPLNPINKIINKMNRLAAGDFKTRLEFGNTLSSIPAMNELTTSFNTMAEELENTELLRNGFINDFSHEFKTPIVSIMGFASLLEKEDLTDEQRRQYARAIREESARLSTMSTNVLNLNKVERQTILTDVTSFNLSEQIRSAVLLLEDKWSRKNIDLRLDFDEFTVEANFELLKQVWINLVDNAVKFTEHGGIVELEIREEKDVFAVTVSNSGEEIPKDKREKLFNKFYQGDESRATGGNGIGLAIVKRIADLHSAKVSVTSKDGFNSFTVTLPKKQA